MGRTTFIAETDGSGHVAWVWRIAAGESFARPIKEPTRYIHELPKASFFGAQADAIAEWFRQQEAVSRKYLR
jgi:hypothetical protein